MTRRRWPHCVECDRPMRAGQKRRHHTCTPGDLAGERCTCSPGCTDIKVGDRGTCQDDCVVCTLRQGRAHDEYVEWA